MGHGKRGTTDEGRFVVQYSEAGIQHSVFSIQNGFFQPPASGSCLLPPAL
jgi:hypothetical protein